MREKTLAGALLSGKCPRCRQGDMFSHPVTHLAKFNKMNAACPHCGVRLEPEPGFYQGAMYVSYAFTVVMIVIIGSTLYLFGDPSEWIYIMVVIGVMLFLVPLNYRLSRIVYLYAAGGIRYDPTWSR